MFEKIITDLFMLCVYILQVIGGTPGEYGFGYYLANIVIFVVLQPALILLFFIAALPKITFSTPMSAYF